MIVRLTYDQWAALFYWGRESQNCDGANESARLLLDVLRELVPAPEHYDRLPPTKRTRPVGAAKYEHSVALPSTTQSPRTRALWEWGYGRGCTTIAESFRRLVALVMRAYPHLDGSCLTRVDRPECLAELARLILFDPAATLAAPPTHRLK